MKIIRDKRAMALPFVLGIVTFVVGVVATLISYAVFQSRLIAKNIESTETYINAVQSIDATIHIIMREQSLDPIFLSNLATYMNVSINEYNDSVWMISSPVSTTTIVKSYISGQSPSFSVYDEQFSFTGDESNFYQVDYITPFSLLTNYVYQFLKSQDPSVEPPLTYNNMNTIFSTIEDDYSSKSSNSISPIFKYFSKATTSYSGFPSINSLISSNLPVTENRYVDAALTIPENRTLEVEDGKVLVINGNITLNANATIKGVVLVNGTISIRTKRNSIQTIEGTVYLDSSVTLSGTVDLGDSNRPSFIISNGTITVGDELFGYGYLLGNNVSIGWLDEVSITGGIYPYPDSYWIAPEVNSNNELNSQDLFNYGIPTTVADTESVGDIVFKFTAPR